MRERVPTCPTCKAKNDSNAMFCLQCGEPLLEGRLAGSFRLLSRLGAGGMGAVYRAEHVRLSTPFAVKVLHRKFAKDERVVARFLREAKATSQLQHEHIVFLADYGEMEAFGPYIAMEYLIGEPLSSRLQHPTALSLHQIHVILGQLCDAMHYSHQQGMIHRDLKPDNVFMMRREEGQDPFVKILDFGIAKVMDEESQQLTSTGAVLGTPSYMAPEQGTGQTVDHLADIYALATILFQMCARHLPFPGNSIVEILSQRMYKEAPRLSFDIPELKDTRLEALIAEGLQREKAQRLRSMKEFKEKLQSSYTALAKRWSPKELRLPITQLFQKEVPPSALALPFHRNQTADIPPPVVKPVGEKDIIRDPGPSERSGFEVTIPPTNPEKPAPKEQSPSTTKEPQQENTTGSNSKASTMLFTGQGYFEKDRKKKRLIGGILIVLLALGGLSWTLFAPKQKRGSQNHLGAHQGPSRVRSRKNSLPKRKSPESSQTRKPSQREDPQRLRPVVGKQDSRPTPKAPKVRPKQRRRTRRRRRNTRRRIRRKRRKTPVVQRPPITPRRILPRRVESAIRRRPTDGCPPNQGNRRWVRLLSNFKNIEVLAGGKKVRRSRKAGGWCISVSKRRTSLEIDGTASNLALCTFSLPRTSRRTIRINLQDSDDQSPGSYCWRGQ